jgi:hypothetical protein
MLRGWTTAANALIKKKAIVVTIAIPERFKVQKTLINSRDELEIHGLIESNKNIAPEYKDGPQSKTSSVGYESRGGAGGANEPCESEGGDWSLYGRGGYALYGFVPVPWWKG